MQGVGFRAWTEYTALERGLQGWVHNRRDGAVEALFAGPAEAVAAMVENCRHGPPGAREVDRRHLTILGLVEVERAGERGAGAGGAACLASDSGSGSATGSVRSSAAEEASCESDSDIGRWYRSQHGP